MLCLAFSLESDWAMLFYGYGWEWKRGECREEAESKFIFFLHYTSAKGILRVGCKGK